MIIAVLSHKYGKFLQKNIIVIIILNYYKGNGEHLDLFSCIYRSFFRMKEPIENK